MNRLHGVSPHRLTPTNRRHSHQVSPGTRAMVIVLSSGYRKLQEAYPISSMKAYPFKALLQTSY